MATFPDRDLRILRDVERKLSPHGTFKIIEDSAGNISFNVGGKNIDDVTDALLTAQSITGYSQISAGVSRTVTDRGGLFRGISGLQMVSEDMKHILGGSVDVKIEKTTHAMSRGVLDKFVSQGITNFVPSAENVDEWDVLVDGVRLPPRQRDELVAKALGMSVGDKKLWKRFGSVVTEERFGGVLNRNLRVLEFEPGKPFTPSGFMFGSKEMSEAAKAAGFDGQTLVSPYLIDEQADALKKSIREAKKLGMDASHPDILQAEKDVKKLRRLAQSGGSNQTLRAMGVVDIEGNPLERDGKVIEGMLKSDFTVVPKSKWRQRMQEMGYNKKQAREIDFITAKGNVTEQLGRKTGLLTGRPASFFTHKMNATEGMVRQDIQSVSAFGDLLNTPAEASAFTRQTINDAQSLWRTQGTLTPSYKESLENVLNEASGATEYQKARARRILAWSETGRPPHGDTLAEGLQGISDIIRRSPGKKQSDPYLLRPFTVSNHLRAAEYAEFSGFLPEGFRVQDGEYILRNGYGMAATANTLAKIHHAHGGSDLDDTIRQSLRYNREKDAFQVIGLRPPLSYGESAVLGFNPENNLAYLERTLRNDARYKDTVRGWSGLEKGTAIDHHTRVVEQTKQTIVNKRQLLQEELTPGIKDLALQELKEAEIANAKSQGFLNKLSQAQLDARRILKELQEAGEIRDITPEELTHFDRINADFSINKSSSRTTYDDWFADPSRGINKAAWESERLAKMVDSAPVMEMDELLKHLEKRGLDVSDLGAEAFLRLHQNERFQGAIGRYFNIEMIADTMRQQMEDLSLEKIIPFTPNEMIIDPLIQGSGDLNHSQIELRLKSMVEGIAEAVSKGTKISPYMMENRFGGETGHFWDTLERIAGDRFSRERPEEVLLDLSNAKEYEYAAVDRNVAETAMTLRDITAGDTRQIRENFTPDYIKNRLFDVEATRNADLLWENFNQVREYGDNMMESFGGTEDWHALAQSISATSGEENVGRALAKQNLAQQLESFFDKETGQFTDEGVNTLGALYQRRGSKLRGIFQAGGLSDLESYMMQALEPGYESGSVAPPLLDTFREATPIIDEDGLPPVLREPIIRPGSAKSGATKNAYGAADDIIDSGGGGAGAVFKRVDREYIESLWANPKFKKASLIGLGVAGFSAIYQKYKDISPEEAEGPPLLPGGSFYENVPDPRRIGLPSVGSNSTGQGVSYNVNVSGDFDPTAFGSELQAIIGDSKMNSSYYNGANTSRISRPRYNQRRKALFEDI